MPENTTSRRSFLRTAGVLGAVGAAGGLAPRALAPGLAERHAQAAEALTPLSMAMHVHACFSEGWGSMEGHLDQASRHGVDVVWWTEHDQRMSAHRYRRAVYFTGLTEYEDGYKWTWAPTSTGSLAASAAAIVTSPVSPRDPTTPGALRLSARGSTTAKASRGLLSQVALDLIRTSLAGHELSIDVLPRYVGPSAYLSIDVQTSYRPARNGRPAGRYTVSYRLGGPYAEGSRTRSGTTGIVTLAAPVGEWTTLRLRPADDIQAIWPDVDGRDSVLYKIVVSATSVNGVTAEGYLDYLQFTRTSSTGNQPLATQAQLVSGYASQFPAVTQHQGLEVSLVKPHLGWYGGTLSLPDHTGEKATPNTSQAAALAAVGDIHDAGGLASYNHMFEHGGPYSGTQQEALRRERATQLITNGALGCDLLEVGYRVRGGVTLERHAAVWDACSRNGIFLTGTGVSDDHSGNNWLGQKWNFLTWAWASGTDKAALVAALAAGRAYFGDPAKFRGRLDLLVDGAARMGSATLSAATSRTVRVIATGLPAGSYMEVIRGLVDYAGPTAPDPVNVVTRVTAAELSTGSVEVSVDTTRSRYVRLVLRDSATVALALSNPVWLLREVPPNGIPAPRRA